MGFTAKSPVSPMGFLHGPFLVTAIQLFQNSVTKRSRGKASARTGKMKEVNGLRLEEDDDAEDSEMEAIALSNPSPKQFHGTLDNGKRDNKCQVAKKVVVVVVVVKKKLEGILAKMREIFMSIKRIVEDQCFHRYGITTANPYVTRIYHVWPGNNVFFFHGRLICGPDPKGLLVTTISITLPSWVFTMYKGDDDLPHHSNLIAAFATILTIIVLVSLFLVSTVDPGIIPRSDEPTIEEIGTSSDGNRRRKKVTINGVELKLKYCRICKIFRPPRSCHCAICDNCVDKFDHHCPWIGQCIALRNYRFYLMFVVSALMFFLYMFAFSCLRIHHGMLRTRTGLLGMVISSPETMALMLFSFAAILFLAGLIIYHLYLMAVNQTAYENYRQCYMGSQNPFDKGVRSNIKEVLFTSLPPSRVDFRAEVTPRV